MISSDSASMSRRPWRWHSAISRSPPARPLETCAARSPNTWSGVRTLWRMMSCSIGLGSPALVELQRRDPQAFLMHVARAGADAVAADVGVVDGRADIADQPLASEDRRQHGDVEEVAGRHPRVVGDDDVAGLEVVVRRARAGARRRAASELMWPGVPVLACATMRPRAIEQRRWRGRRPRARSG